jgi:hypothetical protein
MRAPDPAEIDWRRLSMRGCAILAWIAVPISHGLSHREVAERLNLRRPEIENLPLPTVVSDDWVGKQMRRLRAELRGDPAETWWE